MSMKQYAKFEAAGSTPGTVRRDDTYFPYLALFEQGSWFADAVQQNVKAEFISGS